MSKIVVLATFYPKEEKNDEVKEILLSMINPTRLEEGNELYNFYEEKNTDDQGKIFHLFEIYTDAKALDFHKNTSYYTDYRSKIIHLLMKPIEVKILNSIDTK